MRWNQKWMIIGIMSCLLFNAHGRDSGNPYGPIPASAAVNATAHSLRSLVVGLRFGLDAIMNGNLQEASSTRAFKQPRINDLNVAVARFLRATAAHQAHTVPCVDAEMIDRIEALTGMTITLPECPAHFEEDANRTVKVATSGSVNLSRVNDDFTLTFNDFEILTTHIADGSVHKEVLNVTVTGTVEHTTLCRENEVPDSVTAKINGTFSKKIDGNADGVWEEDTEGYFENFVLDVTVRHFEPSSCVPTHFVVSESGVFTFKDIHKSHDDFTMDIWQNAPAVITWKSVDDSAQVTINGSFTLTSSCSTGALTLNTTEVLGFPMMEADTEIADCPTSGMLTVIGDQTTTVTFTSSGGIDIDHGADGHLDERFENCHDAQFCP